MRFEDWEPIYLEILADFGFSRERDDEAAHVLDEICRGRTICLEGCLGKAIGPVATICGNGPDLERHLCKGSIEGTLIAADGATTAVLDAGMTPDIIVTDLDGDIGDIRRANRMGAIVVVHAHGDNIPALRSAVPWLEGEIALTTQSTPFSDVRNYGGFTDGDRAVELARHFGAMDIHLVGFDFERPRPKRPGGQETKRNKLRWAKRIIYELNPPQVRLSTF